MFRRGARAGQLLTLAVGLLLAGAPVRASAESRAGGSAEPCGPFEVAEAAAPAAAVAETGVAPSQTPDRGGGAIVSLPAAGAAPRTDQVAGEALLALPKGKDGTLATDFELGPGVRVVESFWSPVICATVVRLEGPPDAPLDALVAKLPADAVAVPNHVYVSAAAEVRPLPAATHGPDPYLDLQWGLQQSGALRAHTVTRGAGARVALLDSAPDTGHRDLAGVRNVPLPNAPAPAPAVHGSLMAGVVRAVEGNAFGIAGLAPEADLFAIPVCTPAGASASDACALFDLLRGVDVAWEQHAQVLNLSLVGPSNPLLRRAMDRLESLGVITVASAGNEGVAEPRYPAAYASVIGVGAVDRDGKPYARSNRGPTVEIAAPGVEILSTVPGDVFAFGDGTSLAAAHVSGLLALAVAASPDPPAARAAFFQAAQAGPPAAGAETARAPTACAILERLGKPCP